MGINPSKAIGASNTGNTWRGDIIFKVEGDEMAYYDYENDDETISEIFDKTVNFKKIELLKHGVPHSSNGKFPRTFTHVFVMFTGVDDFYYLIEKSTTSLFVRRSKDRDLFFILNTAKGRTELRVTPVDEDLVAPGVTLLDILMFLEGEKNRKYNMFSENCQHFAERCFNRFSRKVFITKFE